MKKRKAKRIPKPITNEISLNIELYKTIKEEKRRKRKNKPF